MQLEVGSVFEGKVTGITKFGAFVEIPGGKTGMVHISEIAPVYVTEIRDHVSENQIVKVKVVEIKSSGQISLSIKKAAEQPPKQKKEPFTKEREAAPLRPPANIDWNGRKSETSSFEDMLSSFKKHSDDKQSDLKKTQKEGGRNRPRRSDGGSGR
ncbi:MAG: S1 RNA-binding domain-containing protein [Oscillospiraceae bacterium]|jgi:S1 RNA binding domain protein|nr:S1 RNA-binding domain-containing protein [Oscillospiraceae bacterium]